MARPPLNRTAALAVVVGAFGVVGVIAALRWPSSQPALDCPPSRVRWVGQGASAVASCDDGTGGGAAVPPGPAMTLRLKLDLNRATAEELAMVSGIGPALAQVILRGRPEPSGYRSWEELDALPGIGPSKLAVLQQAFELRGPARSPDGGS